jgi:putative oxidoreductase
MEAVLGRWAELVYAVMRFVVGANFATHGAQKLFGLWGREAVPSSNHLIFAAGVIELLCGVLVAVGLRAGIAAFIASGTMAFAYFKAHAADGFWPIVNKGELAVLYCFIFLFIAARGSGKWSVDSMAPKRR